MSDCVPIIRRRQPPASVRAIAFFDGQNLFRMVKEIWGYRFPNYDPGKLAELICARNGWTLKETRFYTGIPKSVDPNSGRPDERRTFWDNKIRAMRERSVFVYAREINYVWSAISGTGAFFPQEKGIDIRIAIDAITSMIYNQCDVVLLFSQDQDFSEVASEVREIARRFSRWIKICSAYPFEPASSRRSALRGVNGCDWQKISRAEYDSCIDPARYR